MSIPDLCNNLISQTDCSFSLDIPCEDPRLSFCGNLRVQCLFPVASIPLDNASCVLSLYVPGNKCLGLQQGGLSHWWQISIPFGISPFAKNHETRCGPTTILLMQNEPCEPFHLDCLHSQHSSGPFLSTFDQNRSMSGCVRLTSTPLSFRHLVANFMESIMGSARAISAPNTLLWLEYFRKDELCVNC